jgi:hypothetical protein
MVEVHLLCSIFSAFIISQGSGNDNEAFIEGIRVLLTYRSEL